MAIFKCKMCGGDLELSEGMSVAECEYCGSLQTVPSADNEKKMTLFSRANRLRAGCEFDKAAGVYETIVADFPEEAEAYWGLLLCRYGIEYVDDPATGKKIPTCHRSSFDSVMEDSDFEQACENADAYARRVYRDEAKAIEELRKGIIAVSANEQPYDIFICYKETADDGERTLDSVLAQDIYDALTGKGYRVFFSRVTLEDKLGVEYEPYIFAALNSARIMLAVGTDYEYYNAVWVKNEWSRFLKLMAADKSKYLIPCFKGLDAYDMPKEFAKLQAQDMGKVGAMQDLLRGIDKIMGKSEASSAPVAAPVAAPAPAANATVDSLLKRAFMFLEDGEWGSADEYCEKVLDIDPENAQAYLGKLMAELKVRKQEKLADCEKPFDSSNNYKKALRFGDDTLRSTLKSYIEARNKAAYYRAQELMDKATTEDGYLKAADRFAAISSYKNSTSLAAKCREKIIELRNAEEEKRHDEQEKHRAAFQAALKKQQESTTGWNIAAEIHHTVALKSDGTVVATGNNDDGRCDVSDWTDIVAVAAGTCHTVGLKADGTVVATGNNDDGRCNVSNWTDIVAVTAKGFHTVGLKADGTVVAVRDNDFCECNVSDWTDIVAVATGNFHTVGLKADGTVVAAGPNEHGECNVFTWRNIVVPEAAIKRMEMGKQATIDKLKKEQNTLQTELAALKGLFSGKRRREIEARLAEIEKELKGLSVDEK